MLLKWPNNLSLKNTFWLTNIWILRSMFLSLFVMFSPLQWINCHVLVPLYKYFSSSHRNINCPFPPMHSLHSCLYETERMSVFWMAALEWFVSLIQGLAVHLFCSWFTQLPIFPWMSLECHTGSTGCAYL